MEGEKKTTSGKMRDYSVLFELQDFLEKEVKEASPGAFYRSFVPLTDGLGLESPDRSIEKTAPQKEVAPPATVQKVDRKPEMSFLLDEPVFMSHTTPVVVNEPTTSGVPVSDLLSHEGSLTSVMKEPEVVRPQMTQATESPQVTAPPPIPQPSSLRRTLSAMIDLLFVLTFWAIALVITSNVYNGFSSGFTTNIFKDFANPVFLRFALLEFAAIWVCYFAVCVGLLDLTFGMWVWHIRVSFGHPSESNFWLRKLMRIIWSCFFFAPVAPLLLLAIRRKGKNLLDLLSGTHLYVAE